MKYFLLLCIFSSLSFSLSCAVGTPCYEMTDVSIEDFMNQSMLAGNIIGGSFLYVILKLFE